MPTTVYEAYDPAIQQMIEHYRENIPVVVWMMCNVDRHAGPPHHRGCLHSTAPTTQQQPTVPSDRRCGRH